MFTDVIRPVDFLEPHSHSSELTRIDSLQKMIASFLPTKTKFTCIKIGLEKKKLNYFSFKFRCSDLRLNDNVLSERFELKDDRILQVLERVRKEVPSNSQRNYAAITENGLAMLSLGYSMEEVTDAIFHHTKLLRRRKAQTLKNAASYLNRYNVKMHDLGIRFLRNIEFLEEEKCNDVLNYIYREFGDVDLSSILKKNTGVLFWDVKEVQERVGLLRSFGLTVDDKYMFQSRGPMTLSAELMKSRMNSLIDFFGPRVALAMVQRHLSILRMRNEALSESFAFLQDKFGFEKAEQMFLSYPSMVVSRPECMQRNIDELSELFGEEETMSMVTRVPRLLYLDWEKNLEPKINYFLDVAERKEEELVKNPNIFLYSLEKRIIPRMQRAQQMGVDKICHPVRLFSFSEAEFQRALETLAFKAR